LAQFAELRKNRAPSKPLVGFVVFVCTAVPVLLFRDESGKIQAYLKKDELGAKDYALFTDLLDVGDIVQVIGNLFSTKKGEKTILVKKFVILTKALLPLPEKWHGLSDVEIRFRQRYLDLLANQEVKEVFFIRTKIVNFIRNI
jgi:lysyl-tRNA synthetase class 2